MNEMSVKVEEAKNLDVSVSSSEPEQLNSYSELIKAETLPDAPTETPAPEGESEPEYATPPQSSNFDTKTGAIIGIITLISSSPIFLKLLEGGQVQDLAVFTGDLIKNNIWIIGILGAIYLLRETLHGLAKQWTFGKIIDSKADKSKNNVEIKTE